MLQRPKLFFSSGLKRGGMDNSVCWHAERLVVLCLQFREKKPARQRVSSGLGNAGREIQELRWGRVPKTWQIPLPCLVSGEGAATVHGPAKHLRFDIISIFQRKHIPPENFH